MYFKRLKSLRLEHNLLQKEVAAMFLLKRPQYSLYEAGKRDIPIEFLMYLAKYYNVSIDYIVGHTDVRTRYPEVKKKKKFTPNV